MGKIILYIAQSIDGFIADENGGIGFLDDFVDLEAYGHSAFYSTIGSVIMATKTYEDNLKFNYWYEGVDNYLFTNKGYTAPEGKTLHVKQGDPEPVVHELRKQEKDSWLIGGASLITQFMNKKLVDVLSLNIVPRPVGKGIALFYDIHTPYKLTLTSSKTFPDSLVQLWYDVQY